MTEEKFTFFWAGPFSQWEPSPMEIDGIEYNCAEQYMMHQKALFFGDNETAEKIMKTVNPSEQKMYGRMVKNFDVDAWSEVACDIVYKGSYAKFTQNPILLQHLMNTEDTTLVEASPYDKIWGIGLKEDDPKAQSRDTWEGKNWLGQILTDLREELKKSNSTPEKREIRTVKSHIRKHMTIGEDGKISIEETLVPEREAISIEDYAKIYCEKMKIKLENGVRVIHPDDHQCYEYNDGVWTVIAA